MSDVLVTMALWGFGIFAVVFVVAMVYGIAAETLALFNENREKEVVDAMKNESEGEDDW